MAVEEYVESIIIRRDGVEVLEPSFVDDDCDKEFKFDGILVLKQIIKSVQNATHNKHDYVFIIKEIKDMEKV